MSGMAANSYGSELMRTHPVVPTLACILLTHLGLFHTVIVAQDESAPPPIRVQELKSGVKASFRGLAMKGAGEAWVSGSDATVIRTTDGGKNWQRVKVTPDSVQDKDGKQVKLDFRDVEVLPDGSVLLMSIGNGAASKVLRSSDAGKTWKVVLENKDEAGFFDGMSFATGGKRGVLYGDPINGRLDMYVTGDGGQTWRHVPEEFRPELKKGEYGFAASGSGAAIVGREIWIATGGSVARLLRSKGGPWESTTLKVRSGNESSGVFSLAVDGDTAIVIGGDYKNPKEADRNVGVSLDGGKTWDVSQETVMPHKACIRPMGTGAFLACGRTGIAFTSDSGETWSNISAESYYVLQVDRASQSGYLAGSDGRVARFSVAAGR